MKSLLCILLLCAPTFGQTANLQTQVDRQPHIDIRSLSLPGGLILGNPAAVLQVDGTIGGIGIGTPRGVLQAMLSIRSPGMVNGAVRDMIELHSEYGIGIGIFTHADLGFRAPQATFYRSRGTQAMPANVQEGDVLGYNIYAGYDGNLSHDIPGYSQPAAFFVAATENYDATRNGAQFFFQAIPDGGTTLQNIFILNPEAATFYEPIKAPVYQTTLRTPSSSVATCTAGAMWADSEFVYVCTATDTIKRAALSAF